MTLNTFSSGVNTSFSTELNENVLTSTQVLASDSTGTTWDEGDTTYFTLATLTSNSDIDNDYVLVTLDVDMFGGANSGSYTQSNIRLSIGESGSEAVKRTFKHGAWTTSSGGWSSISSGGLQYYHELAAGEKTNGVSVIIEARHTGSGTFSGSDSEYFSSQLWGLP